MGSAHHTAHSMSDYPDEARARSREVPGPFEGYILGATDVPVRIRDLSLDGCLVELGFGTMGPQMGTLQVDLPGEGWTVIRCERLHTSGLIAFVRFVRLNGETRQRLERAIDRLVNRPPEDDSPVIKGGGQ